MADYVIINSTGAEFTNVNAGGSDVAARTVSGNITLTDSELAAVCALDGAAVMQASATAAEKNAVANVILDGAAATDYSIYNGSGAALSNVNAGGDDVGKDGSAKGVALEPAELFALLATAGVAVTKDAPSRNVARAIARVLRYRKEVSL